MKRAVPIITIICMMTALISQLVYAALSKECEPAAAKQPYLASNNICFINDIRPDVLCSGDEHELEKCKQNLGLCSFLYSKTTNREGGCLWKNLPVDALICETDVQIMRSFLEQTAPSGKTNGEMLCKGAYDRNNPRTWVGTVWHQSDINNEYHITTLVTDPGVLSGSFGVSVGTGYELGGTLDMRGMPLLTALWCGSCGQFDEIILTDLHSLSTVNFPHMKLEGRIHIDGCNNIHAIDFADSDLQGLDLSGCTSLVGVNCKNNPDLAELILPDSDALDQISCGNTALKSLDVSNLTNLRSLAIEQTNITDIDLSHNPKLSMLMCDNTHMDVLDLSACIDLSLLSCRDCGLRKLVLPKSEEYSQIINCDNNYLTELDTSGNSTLAVLTCSNNCISSLDLSDNFMIVMLDCSNNYITELDVSEKPYLETLRIDNNRINKLALNKNSAALFRFTCSHNLLTELDISSYLYLTEFDCSYNAIRELDLTGQTSFDPYNERYLCNFNYEGNPIVSIKNAPYENSTGEHTKITVTASGGGYAYVGTTGDTDYKSFYAEAVCAGGDFSGWYDGDVLVSSEAKIKLFDTAYTDLQARFTGEEQSFSPAEQAPFPDKVFYEMTFPTQKLNNTDEGNIRAFLEQTDANGTKNGDKLCKRYDADNPATWDCISWCEMDGESRVQCLYFNSRLDYAGSYTPNADRLVGKLDMSGCNALCTVICTGQDTENADFTGCTSLRMCDLSGCEKLKEAKLNSCERLNYLNTSDTAISNIDISTCTSLLTLDIASCGCKVLNTENNKKLLTIKCDNNELTQLNLKGLSSLQYLNCSQNSLSTIDTSYCGRLLSLNSSGNELTELNVTSGKLQSLVCCKNKLKSLELPTCKLYRLDVSDNELTEIKNVDSAHTPELVYFSARANMLTELDLEKLPLLLHMDCSDNELIRLNLKGCFQLACLRCSGNKLSALELPDTGMDIHFLFELDCSDNSIRELDLMCVSENLHTLNISGNPIVSIVNAPLGYILRQPIGLTDSRFYRINLRVQGAGYIDYDLDTITAIGDDFTGFYSDGTMLTNENTLLTDGMQSCNILVCFGDFSIGDVNGNGDVNTADAVLVLKEAAGMINLTTEQLIYGDCNHDGKVNTADAVLILKYAAGMITSF